MDAREAPRLLIAAAVATPPRARLAIVAASVVFWSPPEAGDLSSEPLLPSLPLLVPPKEPVPEAPPLGLLAPPIGN